MVDLEAVTVVTSLILFRAIEKVDASGRHIDATEFVTATCTPENLQVRNHPAFKFLIAVIADEDQSNSPDMLERWNASR